MVGKIAHYYYKFFDEVVAESTIVVLAVAILIALTAFLGHNSTIQNNSILAENNSQIEKGV